MLRRRVGDVSNTSELQDGMDDVETERGEYFIPMGMRQWPSRLANQLPGLYEWRAAQDISYACYISQLIVFRNKHTKSGIAIHHHYSRSRSIISSMALCRS